jgi:nitroreductase
MTVPPSDPPLFQTMYTARALRRLKPEPIPDEVLFQLFDAAIRAPSGQNVQDWRFIVIKDPTTKAQLQEWGEEAWLRYQARYAENSEQIDELPRSQRLSLRSVEHLARNLATAPAIVAVLGLKGRHSTPGGSTFPAVQNLLLAARAQGLGGSIFNLPLGHRDELKSMLDIPDNNEIYCLVPIGYPTDRHGPLRRKPVKQIVFIDRWQNPWPFAQEQPDDGWPRRWVPES